LLLFIVEKTIYKQNYYVEDGLVDKSVNIIITQSIITPIINLVDPEYLFNLWRRKKIMDPFKGKEYREFMT
jgi:hypothetical protein